MILPYWLSDILTFWHTDKIRHLSDILTLLFWRLCWKVTFWHTEILNFQHTDFLTSDPDDILKNFYFNNYAEKWMKNRSPYSSFAFLFESALDLWFEFSISIIWSLHYHKTVKLSIKLFKLSQDKFQKSINQPYTFPLTKNRCFASF